MHGNECEGVFCFGRDVALVSSLRRTDLAGAQRAKAGFDGTPGGLHFYPKDLTPGCTQESCDFRDSIKQVSRLGAEVFGISADSLSSHAKFKSRYGLPFDLLSDEGKETLKTYGVWQEKSLYGRKFMGIVRTTVIVDKQGIIQKIFPKVKVTGHVGEVISLITKNPAKKLAGKQVTNTK